MERNADEAASKVVADSAAAPKRAVMVLLAVLWAVILLAFPVASGVLVVALHAGATEERLEQAAFMCLSVVVLFAYCRIEHISRAPRTCPQHGAEPGPPPDRVR